MKNLLLLSLACISCHVFSQELMSENKFTQYLQEEVAKSNKKLRILVFDDLILGSKFNNASYLHNLKNDYPNYKSEPENLQLIANEIILRIDSIYAPDPNYAIDTTKIVPLLKPKEFLSTIATNDESDLVYDGFNDDLVVVYAEDQNTGYLGYRFFSSNELKRIGYDKAKLYDLSLRNLKAMLFDYSEYVLDKWNYRYYRNLGGEGGSKYLASLILLPDFIDHELKRLKQNFIVALPENNQLIVISRKNRAGIREIKSYAASDYFLRADHLLTKKLFLWDGKEFKRFK